MSTDMQYVEKIKTSPPEPCGIIPVNSPAMAAIEFVVPGGPNFGQS